MQFFYILIFQLELFDEISAKTQKHQLICAKFRGKIFMITVKVGVDITEDTRKVSISVLLRNWSIITM